MALMWRRELEFDGRVHHGFRVNVSEAMLEGLAAMNCESGLGRWGFRVER
jgi:hypothetical protein